MGSKGGAKGISIDIGYLYLENWSAILILVGKGRIGESFFFLTQNQYITRRKNVINVLQ